MCLDNVIGEKQIASEHIVVYKVAYQNQYRSTQLKDTTFRAPFRDYWYTLGTVMNSNLTKDMWGRVYVGFHSFVNYEDADKLATSLRVNNTRRKYYVMKSYIPKGSEYYVGTFDGAASYASNKLMIVRPLTWWETIKLWWNDRPKFGQSVKESP
jgi:hypothetical protein